MRPMTSGGDAEREQANSKLTLAAAPVLDEHPPLHRGRGEGSSPPPPQTLRRPGDTAWLIELSLIATALMWGINLPIVKGSIDRLEPLVFNGVRLCFSALALGLCSAWELRRRRTPAGPTARGPVLAFILLTGLVYQLAFIFGITRTTAGNGALLLSSMPMWTAIVSYFALGERLSRLSWFGLFLSFLGTAIVTLAAGGIDLSSRHLLGNLLLIGGAIIWAVATVISRSVLRTMSPLRLSFLASASTAPIHLAIAAPWLADSWAVLSRPLMLTAVIYSGAVSTGVAYVTWNIGVRGVGGSHAAVYQNLVTVIAVLGAWLFLDEQPFATQLVGGAAILVGLLIMRRGRNGRLIRDDGAGE